MFSGPVREVSGTRIFAREGKATEQFVVYEMHVNAPRELAMVLGLPVDRAKGEKALRFIDLSGYAHFFLSLESGFPDERINPGMASMGLRSAGKRLEVQQVGAFQASFVPTVADFARLDPRFKMPEKVWEKLPKYKDFGFAVFQLRKGEQRYHPMAFAFERADKRTLFFPTVHVHDGEVREKARFDHTFYCQPGENGLDLGGWKESNGAASQFIEIKNAAGVVDGGAHVYRRDMRGVYPNRDITLPTSG